MRAKNLRTQLLTLTGALVASLVARAETITVYTAYESDEAAAFLRAAKADLPDLDMRLIRLSTGDLTARILTEAADPRHDVVWGQAVTNLVDPRILATLEPYFPDAIDRLPQRFRDWAGRWFAVTGYMAAFCINADRLKAKALPMPESWADLTKPAYKGEVAMPNPVSSGTGYVQIASVLQLKGEERGWALLRALDGNVVRYEPSGSAPCNNAAAGQYAIGASFELRAIRNILDGKPITMVIPREGAGNELEASALVKTSQHKAAAKRFLDWTLSENALREYYYWKGIVTSPGGSMPPSFKAAGLPSNVESVMFPMNFDAAARDRPSILARWQQEFAR